MKKLLTAVVAVVAVVVVFFMGYYIAENGKTEWSTSEAELVDETETEAMINHDAIEVENTYYEDEEDDLLASYAEVLEMYLAYINPEYSDMDVTVTASELDNYDLDIVAVCEDTAGQEVIMEIYQTWDDVEMTLDAISEELSSTEYNEELLYNSLINEF